MMDFLEIPPELIICIITLLDFVTKHNFSLTCNYVKELVDNPSNWKNSKIKLKKIDSITKDFWKVLRTRQIYFISFVHCKRLSIKNYEMLFLYLESSLKVLETPCSLLHMDKKSLSNCAINKLTHLVLHCGLPLVPCQGCKTSNLTKFKALKRLSLFNVTNAYFQHLCNDLNENIVESLEVLQVVGNEIKLSRVMLTESFAKTIMSHTKLNEICIPEYSGAEDEFFQTFYKMDISEGAHALPFANRIKTLQLLGECNMNLEINTIQSFFSTISTLILCVQAEFASRLMECLNKLLQLKSLGIKYESVPRPPDYYCLSNLPVQLEKLTLTFQLTVSQTVVLIPPLGYKLLRSGSKWFESCITNCFPKELRSNIKQLTIGTLPLNRDDIDVLVKEFSKLEILSYRLLEEVPLMDNLKLINLPRLRELHLRTTSNLSDLQQLILDESQSRVTFHSCIPVSNCTPLEHIFQNILPSYLRMSVREVMI